MMSVRFHPDNADGAPKGPGGGVGKAASGAGGGGCGGGRLNLLLSHTHWQSECWADRLPTLLEPMGIQSFMAQTGAQASKVIAMIPIHIAVVDLSLPLDGAGTSEASAGSMEEGGTRILELLARLDQPPPTLVVKRGRTHRDDAREMATALRTGAFAVLDRPRDHADINLLLEVMRRVLTRFYSGRWPGMS
jgi:DNA-binding response OmpR family regulator